MSEIPSEIRCPIDNYSCDRISCRLDSKTPDCVAVIKKFGVYGRLTAVAASYIGEDHPDILMARDSFNKLVIENAKDLGINIDIFRKAVEDEIKRRGK